jgi:arylsulfatase A-like enzyme
MLFVDDLNSYVHYLGGYGGVAHTPNIDALAAGGCNFTHAYCLATMSLPSRGGLLWSLSPGTTGIDSGNPQSSATYNQLARDNPDVLPRVLASNGYHTVSTGKVFGVAHPSFWQTFKEYPVLWGLDVPAGPDGFAYGPIPAGTEHIDQTTTNWICEQLQGSYDRPFFMASGYFLPHDPWQLPQWCFDLYPLESIVLPPSVPDDLDDIPPIGQDLANAHNFQYDAVEQAGTHERVMQAYLAAMSHSDALVGQTLNELADSPFADDTYVVFVSDQGYHLGEKRHYRKSALWEASTRAPLILSGPGIAPRQFDRPVSLLDVAPTVLDWAGLPAPSRWEGVSLTDLTPAQADARPPKSYFDGHRALRYQDWRYIRYRDATEELYDHGTDPNEFTNLAGDPAFAPVKAQLAAMV